MKIFSTLLIAFLFFTQTTKSQNQENSQNKKLMFGAGVAYGINRFDENEIKEAADDFNLIPYSSPIYEHENTFGFNAFAAYEFSDLIFAKLEFVYLPGFKSNYTILDILLDYERAFFKSDLYSIVFMPGIFLNVGEKSKFYFSGGLGVLYRRLKIYQQIRGNNLIISDINSHFENDTAIMSGLSVNYFYRILNNINLFVGTSYNKSFGKLSRSNFINVTTGLSISH